MAAFYKNLKAEEFKSKVTADSNAIVLDVRRDSEFAEGHLEQAIHTPNIREAFSSLDKNKHYYLHCRVGGRSAIACQILITNGFTEVYNLNDNLENLDIELVK